MKILFFSFVLFLVSGVYAQKHPDDLIEIHYDGENSGSVGSPKKDLIIAAKLTEDMLSPYVGHVLSAIEIYIHNAPVGNTGSVKIYSPGYLTAPGDLIYSSSPVHVDSNSWNIIPLTESVTIPHSELWIGFEAVSGPSGWQAWAGYDSGPNDPDGQYIYFSNAWYTLTFLGSFYTYNWNIRALVEKITDVKPISLPPSSKLSQNYPNPFNPNTTINITLAHNSWVSLKVYNTLGQEVSVLLNTALSAGEHNVNFNAGNLPSGIYYYKLNAEGIYHSSFTSIKKMLLVK
ncbi:MAG: T9SS type A sorting domain-containing protein [Ignavibacteriaceae bacterium]|nr:T9SS type A sorting domain-containing protein [Ignavibacteriaceae bacterium]